MTMKYFIALLFSCLLHSAGAQSVNCDSAQTQTEMMICAQQALKKSDSTMNAVYMKLLAALDTGIASAGGETADEALYYVRIKTSVGLSQQHWLAMRDANANTMNNVYYMGSIAPMMISIQRNIDTEARTKYLSMLLEDLGY
jgi:uncharacterized protein YecT (DUF1311 family)